MCPKAVGMCHLFAQLHKWNHSATQTCVYSSQYSAKYRHFTSGVSASVSCAAQALCLFSLFLYPRSLLCFRPESASCLLHHAPTPQFAKLLHQTCHAFSSAPFAHSLHWLWLPWFPLHLMERGLFASCNIQLHPSNLCPFYILNIQIHMENLCTANQLISE